MNGRKLMMVSLAFIIAAIVLCLSYFCSAQGLPVAHPENVVVLNSDSDIPGLIAFLVAAFQAGNFFAVGGIVIMLIVWGVAKYIPDPKFLPLISAGIGMLGGLVTGFFDGSKPWYTTMYMGFLTGSAASHFWGMFGKYTIPALNKITKKNSNVEEKKEVDKNEPIS